MAFKEVEIEVLDTEEGCTLIAEYEKLERIYDEQGDNHGHTIIAQIFSSNLGPPYYYLSGRVLNPEETNALAAILRISEVE